MKISIGANAVVGTLAIVLAATSILGFALGRNAHGQQVPGPPPAPFEGTLDLPVTPGWSQSTEKPPAPKTPPPPVTVDPPVSVTPPPTIYGRDIVSESASVFYVIDISGSMSWDVGQYALPDGTTGTGARIDRAKAELTRSVLSLPSSFRFNMLAYDCGIYPWQAAMVPADAAGKASAVAFISGLQPQGATGTGPAVCAALADKTNRLVVLLTDGAPNCGAGDGFGDPACIASHLQMLDMANVNRAVINVFGIGATGDFKAFCVQVASDNAGFYTDVR